MSQTRLSKRTLPIVIFSMVAITGVVRTVYKFPFQERQRIPLPDRH